MKNERGERTNISLRFAIFAFIRVIRRFYFVLISVALTILD
jgi:hypothetical protein